MELPLRFPTPLFLVVDRSPPPSYHLSLFLSFERDLALYCIDPTMPIELQFMVFRGLLATSPSPPL